MLKMINRARKVLYHNPNYTLMIVLGILVGFGLIVLTSASSPKGYEQFGDPYYYLKHQLIYGVFFGAIIFYIMMRIDYHYWKRWAFPVLVGTVVLLLLVLVPGIGVKFLGASRWINIGGLSLQPSEVVKLTFLMYLSTWFEKKEKITDITYGLPAFLIMLGFLVIVVGIIQKDLGTMIVIGAIALGVYFVAGAPKKSLAIIALVSVIGLALLIKIFPHRVDRLAVFLNPELDPQGIGYQINQALLGIGSGGFWGVGLGHSRQKFQYLPEAYADSIFAIIGEELGFIFTLGIITLFLILMREGFRISRGAPDDFGKYMAAGITLWVAFQAFVNIAAMLGLVPLTGIPLPFVSYGGTSLIMILSAMGILLNISKQTRYDV